MPGQGRVQIENPDQAADRKATARAAVESGLKTTKPFGSKSRRRKPNLLAREKKKPSQGKLNDALKQCP